MDDNSFTAHSFEEMLNRHEKSHEDKNEILAVVNSIPEIAEYFSWAEMKKVSYQLYWKLLKEMFDRKSNVFHLKRIYLASKIGKDKADITRAVKQLVEFGVIKYKVNEQGRYFVLMPASAFKELDNNGKPKDKKE